MVKYIGIRFIQESDIISEAIREVTFSDWTHVEFITEEGTYIGAHAQHGVQERPPDYCKPTKERRYAIPVTETVYELIWNSIRATVGKTPYDFAAVLGQLVRENMSSEGRAICSEYCTSRLMDGGIDVLNVLPGYTNRITPEILHLSPIFKGHCVYDSDQQPKG